VNCLLHTSSATNETDVTSSVAENFSYSIQKPYDVPVEQRYSLASAVHHFWVYDTDKPHSQGSNTEPRTEMRMNNDYRSGVNIFDGDILVPSGVSGATVFQVFGGDAYQTAAQIRIIDGSFRLYGDALLASNVYDKWFHIKVQHDVSNHNIKIWINGVQKVSTHDNGNPTNTNNGYYFKCGVYISSSPTHKVESKFKNLVISSGSSPNNCQWAGHCLGDPCQTYNDCDGNLICVNGKCSN